LKNKAYQEAISIGHDRPSSLQAALGCAWSQINFPRKLSQQEAFAAS
jgi:hypothetical protein